MIKFGKAVVKLRIPILILSIFLLIPSAIGYFNTRVNYDILTYLPEEIETMKGQDLLLDEFGTGAFSFCVVEGMDAKDISAMREQMEEVPHVKSVIWYDSLADISIPMEMLPDEIYDFFNNDEKDSTLLAVLYDTSMSADETMDAIEELRGVVKDQCYISGMSAVVTDIKNLSNKETPVYVLIAVVLAVIVLSLTMDSALAPIFFLLSIGMAIVYNLGTNVFKGEISYVTQALAAVLQLGVTMDYSIFLWHSYEEQQERFQGDKKRAMAHAISNTITSVVGSSITTVAGFVALCFMSFTLGLDLGIVMAKGVVIGVICCITVLPSMILVFDKALEKTMHKDLVPSLEKPSKFIIKHHAAFIVLFIVVLIPAVYGQINTNVYYNLTDTLPKDLNSVIANTKLDEEYNMATTHMLLVDADMEPKEVNSMLDEMGKVDGVSFSMSLDTLIGPSIPREIVPDSVTKILKSDKWQLMLIGSEYKVASDEENAQIDELSKILKSYDKDGMLIGEAAATKDLIDITDHDFKVVNIVSIAAIFIIILVALRSVSLPIILVAVIEFAITVNMGVPCFTNTTIPFIASVVIGTIQLGATVDYAILMTTRYKTERNAGKDKHEAVTIALTTSMKSIMVSALGFFASTFGVGVYSSVDMISQLCTLMSRGAIISMITVICILPSMLMLFDKVIINTTMGMKKKENKLYKLPEIN